MPILGQSMSPVRCENQPDMCLIGHNGHYKLAYLRKLILCRNPLLAKLLRCLVVLKASGFLLCVLISFIVEKKQKVETRQRYKKFRTMIGKLYLES